jgi:phosphoribosylformylglycinamidine synthase
MKEVVKHANKGGLLLGICNGFQILCEAGLLPGALLHNNNQKFICKNTFLKACSNSAGITEKVNKDRAYKIPIAHGEGRYYAKKKVVEDLFENDQVLFQYCDLNGQVTENDNPNGSMQNIAGVSNKNKNIMGMMPHPERAVEPLLGNTDGVALFESLLHSA